jgi:hypothetical protein
MIVVQDLELACKFPGSFSLSCTTLAMQGTLSAYREFGVAVDPGCSTGSMCLGFMGHRVDTRTTKCLAYKKCNLTFINILMLNFAVTCVARFFFKELESQYTSQHPSGSERACRVTNYLAMPGGSLQSSTAVALESILHPHF